MILRTLLVLGMVTAHAPLATGADLKLGMQLSRQCAACHGRDGIARDPEVPNLAGQSSYYIEKSMVDYQTGAREDRRMTLIAESLTLDEIKAIAAWYEAHQVDVSVPKP